VRAFPSCTPQAALVPPTAQSANENKPVEDIYEHFSRGETKADVVIAEHKDRASQSLTSAGEGTEARGEEGDVNERETVMPVRLPVDDRCIGDAISSPLGLLAGGDGKSEAHERKEFDSPIEGTQQSLSRSEMYLKDRLIMLEVEAADFSAAHSTIDSGQYGIPRVILDRSDFFRRVILQTESTGLFEACQAAIGTLKEQTSTFAGYGLPSINLRPRRRMRVTRTRVSKVQRTILSSLDTEDLNDEEFTKLIQDLAADDDDDFEDHEFEEYSDDDFEDRCLRWETNVADFSQAMRKELGNLYFAYAKKPSARCQKPRSICTLEKDTFSGEGIELSHVSEEKPSTLVDENYSYDWVSEYDYLSDEDYEGERNDVSVADDDNVIDNDFHPSHEARSHDLNFGHETYNQDHLDKGEDDRDLDYDSEEIGQGELDLLNEAEAFEDLQGGHTEVYDSSGSDDLDDWDMDVLKSSTKARGFFSLFGFRGINVNPSTNSLDGQFDGSSEDLTEVEFEAQDSIDVGTRDLIQQGFDESREQGDLIHQDVKEGARSSAFEGDLNQGHSAVVANDARTKPGFYSDIPPPPPPPPPPLSEVPYNIVPDPSRRGSEDSMQAREVLLECPGPQNYQYATSENLSRDYSENQSIPPPPPPLRPPQSEIPLPPPPPPLPPPPPPPPPPLSSV
jgi:hypothetical protein